MIKYYKELENRLKYYLTLVNVEDKGKKVIFNYEISLLFIEKYAILFKNGESLISIYKNFNIDEDNQCLKEYPEEFLAIRRLLKTNQFY